MPSRAANLLRQLVAERSPIERLKQQQLDRLQTLVHDSYEHTVAYRCLMQRAGVRPDSILSLSDIERLPIVNKQDLLEFTEEQRTSRLFKYHQRARRIFTSGSTGVPYEFDIDAAYDRWRKAQYLRPYITTGRRPLHKVLRFTALTGDRQYSAPPWNPFRERLMPCTSPTSEQISALMQLRPAIVQGYPSALRCLAFELRSGGIRTPYVRIVYTDSELLTPDTRALIGRAFGAPVLDIYGSFETDNMAYQCSAESTYHVAIDSVIAESTVDDDPVIDCDGDLVVTVLHNRVTPFIRYNLQDQVRLLRSECGCGRTFPMMAIVAGRRDDLIVCSDGSRRSPMSMLDRLDQFGDLVREYQIAQTGLGDFTVHVVPKRILSADDEARIRDAVRFDTTDSTVTIKTHRRLARTEAQKLKAFVNEMRPAHGNDHGN